MGSLKIRGHELSKIIANLKSRFLGFEADVDCLISHVDDVGSANEIELANQLACYYSHIVNALENAGKLVVVDLNDTSEENIARISNFYFYFSNLFAVHSHPNNTLSISRFLKQHNSLAEAIGFSSLEIGRYGFLRKDYTSAKATEIIGTLAMQLPLEVNRVVDPRKDSGMDESFLLPDTKVYCGTYTTKLETERLAKRSHRGHSLPSH